MVTDPPDAQFITPTVIPNVTPEPIVTKDAMAVKGIVQVRSPVGAAGRKLGLASTFRGTAPWSA